jgi:hypothetical protein
MISRAAARAVGSPTLPHSSERRHAIANYYAVVFWGVIIAAVIIFVWHPWLG